MDAPGNRRVQRGRLGRASSAPARVVGSATVMRPASGRRCGCPTPNPRPRRPPARPGGRPPPTSRRCPGCRWWRRGTAPRCATAGSTQASGRSTAGSWLSGKNVPENRNMGRVRNRMITGKPWSSSWVATHAISGAVRAMAPSTAAGMASTPHHDRTAPSSGGHDQEGGGGHAEAHGDPHEVAHVHVFGRHGRGGHALVEPHPLEARQHRPQRLTGGVLQHGGGHQAGGHELEVGQPVDGVPGRGDHAAQPDAHGQQVQGRADELAEHGAAPQPAVDDQSRAPRNGRRALRGRPPLSPRSGCGR